MIVSPAHQERIFNALTKRRHRRFFAFNFFVLSDPDYFVDQVTVDVPLYLKIHWKSKPADVEENAIMEAANAVHAATMASKRLPEHSTPTSKIVKKLRHRDTTSSDNHK